MPTTESKVTILQKMIYLVRLGRPFRLLGGIVFNALGIAVAIFLDINVDWRMALWCQLAITASQFMTHYSNEYFDLDADAANLTPTFWAGGSQILPAGLLPARAALTAALVWGFVALVAAAVLTLQGNSPLLTCSLLLLAIFLAWNYSGPPLRLNRRGLGEITGALLVPALTTLISFQVQTGKLTLLPFLAVLPLCFFQFAMLLAVNFPDAAGDALVNKRTLVVILGPQRAAGLYLLILLFAYMLLPVLLLFGLPLAVTLALLLTLPLAAWLGWHIRQGAFLDPKQWDVLSFWSMALLIIAALLEITAFIGSSQLPVT